MPLDRNQTAPSVRVLKVMAHIVQPPRGGELRQRYAKKLWQSGHVARTSTQMVRPSQGFCFTSRDQLEDL